MSTTDGRPQLVAARKMPDGSIRYGKSGEIHADLFRPGENLYGFNDINMGFALPGRRFLTREQALEAVKRGTPEVAIKFRPPAAPRRILLGLCAVWAGYRQSQSR